MQLEDLCLGRRVRWTRGSYTNEGRVVLCGPADSVMRAKGWATSGDFATYKHWSSRPIELKEGQVLVAKERWSKDGVTRLRPTYYRLMADILELI